MGGSVHDTSSGETDDAHTDDGLYFDHGDISVVHVTRFFADTAVKMRFVLIIALLLLLLLCAVELTISFTATPFLQRSRSFLADRASSTALFGKKAKRKGGTKKSSSRGQQAPQEKKSVKEACFDAQTRQFMFTMAGLTKVFARQK